MSTVPRLVPCRSCNRDLSIEAVTCPSCGAPNKWIHPKIENFLREKDNTGVTEPFTFNYEKLRISGQTEKRVPRWILWAGIVFFLLLFIPIALLGTVGLAFGPIGFVTAIVLALIFKFSLHAAFANNKTFLMDFESDAWQSNDDVFWSPVKKLLTS